MDLKKFTLLPGASVKAALECLNKNQKGIVLVIDESRRLLGTVTDGDIRRALLDGKNLETEIRKVMNPNPIFLTPEMDDSTSTSVFRASGLRQIPVLNGERHVMDLRFAEENLLTGLPTIRVVIMAGGMGKRLRPLTLKEPKPLLKVGQYSIIEHNVMRLAEQGFHEITVSTGYLKDQIKSLLQGGEKWNVRIQYIEEESALGTFGALGLLQNVQEDKLLVMNGDLVTDIDFVAMLRFHEKQRADFSIAVRRVVSEIPYGVVQIRDLNSIVGIQEKPGQEIDINAGIYIMNTELLSRIKPGAHLDAPDFVRDVVLKEDRAVKAFFVTEEWADIGRPEELKNARKNMQSREKN